MAYKMPTVGDQVLYFHNGGDPICAANRGRMLPAIVVGVEGSQITLTIFTKNPDALVVQRGSVVHREETLNKAKRPYKKWPYWMWPGE